MKNGLFLIILLCSTFSSLFAQSSLSGKVVNELGKALEFATIAVYPISDSTDVQGVISEPSGSFKLQDLKAATYQVVVQMLGYQDWEQEVHLAADVVLEEVVLKEESHVLEDIAVVAERSHLQSRLGKKVLRIGQDLSDTGSTALEALELIPSVTTTQRGGIQIRGSSKVVIYINGKETKRDANTLQYISADVLEKIEVITNPSAKYDAEGVAGIINLVYKKGNTSTFKLESILNVSLPRGASTGLNASISKDKLSFYTNVSTRKNWYTDRAYSKRIDKSNTLEVYENEIDYAAIVFATNFNAGLSIEPDTTLSMAFEFNYDRWNILSQDNQSNIFRYRNEDTPLLVNFLNESGELEDELWLNYSMEKTFGSDHKLQLSLTTGGEDEVNFALSDPLTPSDSPTETLQFLKQSDEAENQRYYQGQLDYEAPFFDFGTFEGGVKADFIQYDVLQKIQLRSNTIEVPDNDFSIDMQKLAVYGLHKQEFKRFSYSLGIRMEQFSSEAIQRSNQETFSQDYLQFFPSLQATYLLSDESQTIGFNYTRRINRPGFFDLNPYVSYQDPLNLQQGNPDLQPEIANLYEGAYHKEFEDLSMDITFYRRETKDVIQSFILPQNNNQTLETTANFAKQIHQGIEGQIEYHLTKNIKTTATFVLGQNKFKDASKFINFNKGTSWSIRLKQQIKLPNQWKIEFSEVYRAPSFEPQSKTLAVHYVNAGIAKKFKNGRGRFSLSIRDIFNSRNERSRIYGQDFEIEKLYKWQTRQMTLGLRYFIFNGRV